MKKAASFVTAILVLGFFVAVSPAAADTIVIGGVRAAGAFSDSADAPLSAALAGESGLTASTALNASAAASRWALCGSCDYASESNEYGGGGSDNDNGRHLGWTKGAHGAAGRFAGLGFSGPTFAFSFAPLFSPPSVPFSITTFFGNSGVGAALEDQIVKGTEIGQFILTGANGQQVSGLLIALSQLTTTASAGDNSSAPIPNPEPATMLLFGGGLAVIARRIARKMHD
jgi:hypothetical protein